MAEKITTIIVGILISIGLFLAGYMANQKILAIRNGTATISDALENNSLVKRFNKESPQPKEAITNSPKFPNSLITNGRKNDEVIVYDKKTGKIKTVSLKSRIAEDKATIQPNAQSIQWALDRQRLIAQYSSGFVFYDLEQKVNQKYNEKILNPRLNRQGDKIVYLFFDENDNGSIRVSDPLLKLSKDILATRTKTWQMSWLNENLIGLTNRQSYNKLSSFVLDINKKSLEQIIDAQYVTDILWTPDGSGYLYSYYNQASRLNLDFKDRNNISTTFEKTTFASRCIWSIDSSAFYCLVGENPNDPRPFIIKMNRQDPKAYQTLSKEPVAQIPDSLTLSIDEQSLIMYNPDGTIGVYPTQSQ